VCSVGGSTGVPSSLRDDAEDSFFNFSDTVLFSTDDGRLAAQEVFDIVVLTIAPEPASAPSFVEVPLVKLAVGGILRFIVEVIKHDEASGLYNCQHVLQDRKGVCGMVQSILRKSDIEAVRTKALHKILASTRHGLYRRCDADLAEDTIVLIGKRIDRRQKDTLPWKLGT
jgi:hypothetical protein